MASILSLLATAARLSGPVGSPPIAATLPIDDKLAAASTAADASRIDWRSLSRVVKYSISEREVVEETTDANATAVIDGIKGKATGAIFTGATEGSGEEDDTSGASLRAA